MDGSIDKRPRQPCTLEWKVLTSPKKVIVPHHHYSKVFFDPLILHLIQENFPGVLKYDTEKILHPTQPHILVALRVHAPQR
jgi:hypothetical protein